MCWGRIADAQIGKSRKKRLPALQGGKNYCATALGGSPLSQGGLCLSKRVQDATPKTRNLSLEKKGKRLE